MENHEYHTVICPTVKGWADVCTCASRLTYDQLSEKQQAQVDKITATTGKDENGYLYSVSDGKVMARIQIAKKENGDE